jgi:6-pyruvoyltetrahydropterin/6-carboxytetrahydropterin synthase
MTQTYHVHLDKEYLVFSAAHFIIFNGNICERLHGHNWRVSADVYGPLDENQYVVDFIALRDTLKSIVDPLEHRMLLPTDHPLITVDAGEQEVEVKFEDRRWVFPRGDCVILPIENTTAERIASYIGRKLLDELEARTGTRPEHVRIGVDENCGQWGICELRGE